MFSFTGMLGTSVYAQNVTALKVLSLQDSSVIAGVSVTINGKGTVYQTDGKGEIALPKLNSGESIRLTHISFLGLQIKVSDIQNDVIWMQPLNASIEEVEVVNTGYFSAPKERLAGSYVHIDNKLLNRSLSGNILDRLEGVANGLQFDRGNTYWRGH